MVSKGSNFTSAVTDFIGDGCRALLRLKFRLDRGVRDLDILGQRPRR